jgi:hypothetical protein
MERSTRENSAICFQNNTLLCWGQPFARTHFPWMGIHLSFILFLSQQITPQSKEVSNAPSLYRGADKSLVRPGKKEATATEEF